MSTRIGTIAIIRNASDTSTSVYRYHDGHVDDTQDVAAFLQVRGGWKAAYHVHTDTWHVRTPSGLSRTYECVR